MFFYEQKFRLGKQPHKEFNDHSVKDGKCFMKMPNFPCIYIFFRNSVVKNFIALVTTFQFATTLEDL
jgi:hypothetical protein